ncbi:hypothetical protein ACSTS3_18680 [Aquimarina muelleri]|uniref:hypothetical protein n=1 Tax=Aquimarina muelleri TaxID=279356 RepID=UPI003F687744
MVRIINFSERVSDDGKAFFTLDVQGGIEMVKSQSTGNFYATARKSSITTTFDEATCQALIGTELPGTVEKQDCDPYEYTIKDTGEVIQLSHKFMYVPEEKASKPKQAPMEQEHNVIANSEVFSKNGILEPAM